MSEPIGSFINDDSELGTGSPAERKQSDVGSSEGIPTIKPLDFSFTGTEQPEPKRRRRPRGVNKSSGGTTETGSQTEKAVPNLATTLQDGIWTLCVFASRNFDAPELAITRQQAADIQEATLNVVKFYNQTPDPKVLAWFNLAVVIGFTFYPKVTAVRDRKRAQRKMNPGHGSVVGVTPINRPGTPGHGSVAGGPVAARPNGAPAPVTPAAGKPLDQYSPSELFGFEPPHGDENSD